LGSVMAAEGLRVRGGAISIMLRKMRSEGISEEDGALMNTVLKNLSESEAAENPNRDQDDQDKNEPRIFVLQRNRQKEF
jgi:hypothetical protein